LYSFTSCLPALRDYKTLYFDILLALQERQQVIIDSDNLRDRVSRLLMPLSTWLVIHQGDTSSATPCSAPASPHRDTTPGSPPEASGLPRKSALTRRFSATPHPSAPPEELMPPPSSLPHRFQQPPSTTPRGWHLPQGDRASDDESPGAIRMARTRIPRPHPPCAEPEPPAEPPEVLPPILAQRRTQRFGIFCIAPGGSGVRRRGLTVPQS